MRSINTPHTPAAPILRNEFRQGRSYSNWRPQGSGDWLLIVTQAGVGRIDLPSSSLHLRAGDAVLFAPGALQDYSTDQNTGHWHLRWAHFVPRPHWRTWLMWPQIAAHTGHIHLPAAAVAVNAALGRMLTASRLAGPASADLAMNALEEALLWIFRLTSDTRLSGVDARVQRAVHHLATHLDEPFNLALLAAHCGISSSRLSHLFRAELETSPQRFSEKLRMDFARQLLSSTNLPVGEVAREVGFDDPLYFSRRYRHAFGHSPSKTD